MLTNLHKPRRKQMTITLESPFWKVMSYVMASLVSGAIFITVTALSKLEKVSDAQIETKTLLNVLITQLDKSNLALSNNTADINNINVRLAQMDMVIQQREQGKKGR
jgi:FtsZ-binding cell division protein ZapB